MNLKMPKFGVLVSANQFVVDLSPFVVSRESLRELHVFLPFDEENLTGIIYPSLNE